MCGLTGQNAKLETKSVTKSSFSGHHSFAKYIFRAQTWTWVLHNIHNPNSENAAQGWCSRHETYCPPVKRKKQQIERQKTSSVETKRRVDRSKPSDSLKNAAVSHRSRPQNKNETVKYDFSKNKTRNSTTNLQNRRSTPKYARYTTKATTRMLG